MTQHNPANPDRTRLEPIWFARIGHAVDALLDWAAMSTWRRTLLILLVGCAVIVPGIAAMPVTDRDEGRFVQASKQMLETGDVIDIRFQDQPRWKKPAGIYWLQAASASVFGGAEAPIWAYRLPSALAAFMIALLTAWAAGPLIGRKGAVLAGLMMVTTLLLAVEGNIAKTDAALAASATAALGALAHQFLAQPRRWTALVFWLAIAASILLKGPVVPTVVVLALISFWILRRERPPFARLYPLPGLALTVALVAPWLIAIHYVSDGGFFAEALGKDLGGKLVEGQEKHWGPPGMYLGLVWATFWPWAPLLIIAAGGTGAHRRENWVRLLAGWVLPFWLVLELVPTKLPHYVLPLYPALAILLAGAVLGGATANRRWAARLSAALVALPGVALGLAVVLVPVLLSIARGNWGDGTLIPTAISWPAVLLGLSGAALAIIASMAASRGQILAQIGSSAVAAMLVFAALLQFGLPAARTAFPSPEMARLIAQYRPCASGPAFSIGYHEPSLVFLTETGIRMSDPEGAIAALKNDTGTLVLIEDRWREILAESLPDAVVRARVSYFNYNRGKLQGADLITPDDARWAACQGG